mmetsp:Transcript_115646/g.322186  ORF Transcript_115646/g.322186 Transcript_115646/m.322186 type:complete len:223 (+) Transcript_115646:730-1398(+)
MARSSTASRPSFSRSTSSSFASSRSSCSRCCSTRTRRRRRSRSFLAMLPARFDSLIFLRKSPASCSSSWAFGMRDCRASTSSRAFAAWVVLAMSPAPSPRRSEWSLVASLSLSPSRAATSGRENPRPARLCSKAAMPSFTSVAAAPRVRSSLSCCFLIIELSKFTSWLSRMALTCMFCLHRSMLIAFHSSLNTLFWNKRSRLRSRWISRCSAMRACSRLSSS